MINEEIKSSISNTANDQTVVYQFKELLPHSICNLVQIRDTDSVKNIFEVISQKSDYIFQAESSYSKVFFKFLIFWIIEQSLLNFNSVHS